MFESITSGSRKLFQIATNWNRNMVTSAGDMIRSATVRKILNSLAPSIRPASISSSGIADAA